MDIEIRQEEKQELELYKNQILNQIQIFTSQLGKESPEDLKQSQWSAALRIVGNTIFKNDEYFKKPFDGKIPRTDTGYNFQRLLYLYSIYSMLCNTYDKIIDLTDFGYLIGKNGNSIYKGIKLDIEKNRYNVTNYSYSGNGKCTSTDSTVNTFSSMLLNKIIEDSEKSGVSKLFDSKNPMAAIAWLNNKHGWSDKHQVVSEQQQQAPMQEDDIKALLGMSEQSAIEQK